MVECRVVAGEWFDPWSGLTFDSADEVDIDHHVPLFHAHVTGGSSWDADLRRRFANDPENLNAIASTLNRSKGSRGPDEWQPPDAASHCQYARQWQAVKSKYHLRIGGSERRALDEMLATCDGLPQTPTPSSTASPVLPGVTPISPPASRGKVYESCEEAEAAGEQRIIGSRGDGMGFPRAMVLNARDGDDDGVVCEQ